jgi:DNA-binding CsgD family transcriptional regulator
MDALRLGLKHVTIRHHMTRVRERIGAASIYQVIAVAVEMGWIKAPRIHD